MGARQKALSETEMKIMRFVWSEDRPVSVGDIIEYFHREYGREYARQTINTFAKKLIEKGLLDQEEGFRYHQKHVYRSRISQEEYTRRMLDGYRELHFGGSAFDFAVSLLGMQSFSKDERERLKDYIDRTGDE